MHNTTPVQDEINRQGFSIARQVLDADTRQALLDVLGPVHGAGRRGLLKVPEVARLAHSSLLLDLIRPHLSPAHPPVPVRAIFFDKSPEANWLVPWHQDLTLAVKERSDVPGFGPWSTKEGVPHVQPPVELLEQMLTLRLHFDETTAANGALQVLPGSHQSGRLSTEQLQQLRRDIPAFLCTAAPGDALLMRPLLAHASARATVPGHRRVLHLEYAGFSLPAGLDWQETAAA